MNIPKWMFFEVKRKKKFEGKNIRMDINKIPSRSLKNIYIFLSYRGRKLKKEKKKIFHMIERSDDFSNRSDI